MNKAMINGPKEIFNALTNAPRINMPMIKTNTLANNSPISI